MSQATLTEWQLLTGRDEPLPEQRPLRAGPLTMVLESGDLRYLKLGGREVIRRIYAAVRDRNWGTVPGVISDLRFTIYDLGFRIAYTSTHRQDDIHFVWQAEITGESDGSIRFSFDGDAKSTFLRNRIGFCVLHPIRECAGTKCRALYLNGTEKELGFPEIIAPEQPVRWLHDLSGLAHEVEPGVWAELRFEGDAFEMEDQRNWIDASFKTFCTPLRVPYPLEITAGTRVKQEVRLKIADQRSAIVDLSKRPRTTAISNHQSSINIHQSEAITRITLDKESRRLPALGLGFHPQPGVPDERSLHLLEALRLAHIRVDVRASEAETSVHLTERSSDAEVLDHQIELAVHLDDLTDWASPDAYLEALASQLCTAQTPLARILVFGLAAKHCSSAEGLRLARKYLGNLGVPIGAGTNADLYQLNLQRPPATADFIAWSMNPQVHAFDNASIAETPEAAAQQIASVRTYFPGKPLVVSPVTLKPRFNPVATGPEPAVPPGELPPQVDPRQMSLFGAVWTLAMIKALAEGGVVSMTLFETTGWRGVMEMESGSLLPQKFPSTPGAVFPLYHVLADVGEFVGGKVSLTTSSEPLIVQCLMLCHEKRRRLLLANLQPRLAQAVLTGFDEPFLLRRLNANTAERAMREPEAFRSSGKAMPISTRDASLLLAPYELVTLDFA